MKLKKVDLEETWGRKGRDGKEGKKPWFPQLFAEVGTFGAKAFQNDEGWKVKLFFPTHGFPKYRYTFRLEKFSSSTGNEHRSLRINCRLLVKITE